MRSRIVRYALGLSALVLSVWSFASYDFLGFLFYPVATGLLALLAYGAARRMALSGRSSLLPLTVPVLSVLWLAAQSLPFLAIPRGTAIRPMGWSFYVVPAAFILTIHSIISAATELKRGRDIVACVVGIVLGVLVICMPSLSLWMVAALKGLRIEQ